GLPAGEFHTLLLFATVGMMLMASGNDLVMIFLGLEILSIATYVMAGFRKDDVRSNESSLKYFILGSFSSAFLLFGIALIDGAPTPVTAFMAAGPKAAGFAAFMRVFLLAFPLAAAAAQVKSTGAQLHEAWLGALWLLAVLTMTVGNVVALVQTNVKRMLAYSSIAHAGYALVGFVAAGAASSEGQQQDAVAAVVFYLLAYAVMNIGAFAVVTLIARSGDRRTDIEDYRGIGLRSPATSLSLS